MTSLIISSSTKRNHEIVGPDPAPKSDSVTMPVFKKQKTENHVLPEHAAEEGAPKDNNMLFRFMDLVGGKAK